MIHLRLVPPDPLANDEERACAGRHPLLFHLVPQLLIAGSIEVDGVEQVEWSTPLSPMGA